MGPTLVEEIIPHTITLPFQISQYSKRIKEISIPHFYILQTSYHLPFFLCPQDMLCGKVKTNLVIFLLNQMFATRNLSHQFFLINLREIVFLEIGFPLCSQNAREIDVAVSKLSFKDILTIIRSSHLADTGGLVVLGFGLSALSVLNLLIIWWTTRLHLQNTIWLLHDLLKWAFFLLG